MRDSRDDGDPVESALQFGEVTPSEAADRELRWFFNEADVDCEQPSNYAGLLLGGISPTSLAAVEARAEANHAAGKIKEWLAAVPTDYVLLLEGAYRERVWSQTLSRVLGPLVGAVVALPAVRVMHLRALASARTEADTPAEWIEELAGTRDGLLAAWRKEAERGCAIGIRVYEQERGNSECVVPNQEVE